MLKTMGLIAALTVALIPRSAVAQTLTPGFGSDDRSPVGAPWSLPPGLEFAGPVRGADDDGLCPTPRTATSGSGMHVRVCLPVKNRTRGPVTVIFPPGLTVVSASETFQNGVLVERSVVTVPATANNGPGRLPDKAAEEAVVYVPLHLYCMNPSKRPADATASFTLGPVTAHAGLSPIYDLLEQRNIAGDQDAVEAVQEAINDIVGEGRISETSQEYLQAYVIDRDGG